MKNPAALPTAISLFAGFMVSLSTHAQSIEPRRYVNNQGVEVLMSRNSLRPPDGAAETASAAPVRAPATPRDAAAAPLPTATASARNEARIGPAQQAARDEERERVLNIELLDEGSQLEIKRKALRSPRVEIDLDSGQRAKLVADVERHEENIRALTRELARARAGRSAARASGYSQPAAVNFTP